MESDPDLAGPASERDAAGRVDMNASSGQLLGGGDSPLAGYPAGGDRLGAPLGALPMTVLVAAVLLLVMVLALILILHNSLRLG